MNGWNEALSSRRRNSSSVNTFSGNVPRTLSPEDAAAAAAAVTARRLEQERDTSHNEAAGVSGALLGFNFRYPGAFLLTQTVKNPHADARDLGLIPARPSSQ